jgi:hypothetical protein
MTPFFRSVFISVQFLLPCNSWQTFLPIGPLAWDLQLDLFAVVTQRYEPEVQSPGGFLGNDVIIRCNVPAFVKEHVTVTSWLQEPSFNIYPSAVSGK